MRRSCNFCRSRKIRCSGATICSACSERKIDCVYAKEGSKGRPKGPTFKNSSRGTAHDNTDPKRLETPSASAQSLASNSHSTGPFANRPPDSEHASQPSRKRSAADGDGSVSLAAELEAMFDENFKDAGLTADNPFQESLAAFQRTFSKDPTFTIDSVLGFSVEDTTQRRIISYEQLLCNMTQEMVEMLSVRFGNLGCYRLDDSSTRFYAVSLARDQALTMFEAVDADMADPLIDIDSHRTLQMIEVWFSIHPLSNIISKTLFLQLFKSNTHDPALLAVMLADASYMHLSDVTGDNEETLFQWAASQLRDRPALKCTLSTIQVLMLLGWHDLCLSRARRATCYLGYAGRIATRLQTGPFEITEGSCSQINGVDVAEVEAELVRNIYWLTFSITLWSFMQIDRPYPQLLPNAVPTEFPPVDESSSAVVRLEIASDNISTLAKQSRMIQELWPLSHIASTTAHIYALLPRARSDEGSQFASWQSQPLHQLRQLLSLNQNISILCESVRKILVNAVEMLEIKVHNASSKALVLTAYHTTIIHLLFPRPDSLNDRLSRVFVSGELLASFCASSKSLLDLFKTVDADHDSAHLITQIRSSTFADVFVLGLDVCSRAIDYFHTTSKEGSARERDNISSNMADLLSIVSHMHRISKSETLLTAKNLRPVKKNLKRVKLLFRTDGGSANDSSMDDDPARSFDNGSSNLSVISTTSNTTSNATQATSIPDFDGPVPNLSPFDFNALPSDIWSNSNPFDLLSGGDNQSIQKIGWVGDEEAHVHKGDDMSGQPSLPGQLDKSAMSPARRTMIPTTQSLMATDQQGYIALGACDISTDPMDINESVHGLYNIGMGTDFSNIDAIDGSSNWALNARPPSVSKPP